MRAALLALVLAGCSSSNPYPGRPNPTNQWSAYGTSTGIVVQALPNPFTIPAQPRSVNYVYKASGPVKQVTLNYSIDGNATFGTVDGGTPSIRLFIWANGDTGGEFGRWWCAPTAITIGDNQTVSCSTSDQWTDVNGQINPAALNTAASNPFAVGFTFGGEFAGHGVWTTTGSATFTVNSFVNE